MPWKIYKDGDKYCVHKLDGDQKGDRVACHDSEADAKQQLAALYVNEPGAKAVAVRMVEGSDDLIEGLGMPFGGPFDGQDLYGEHFSAKTDFALPWFTERPALYHHGLDDDAGISVVGRVKAHEVRADLGVWTKVQLDKSSEYFSAIKELVKEGKLFFSSGAMAHLVDVDKKSGEIRRWPWVELSLTPTPANLLATVDVATASKHYRSAGLELPAAVRIVSRQRMQEMASEIGMEMSEADMDAMMEGAADMSEAEMKKRLMQKKASKGGPAVKAKLAGSYEDLIAKLDAACNPIDPVTGYLSYDCHVIATFPDHCIVRRYEEKGPSTYWKIAYGMDESGMPMMGESQQMEQTYVPMKPDRPMGMMAWAVAIDAAELAECTKGLIQRRLKEGRVISTANRKRLADCLESMRGAVDALQTLLDSSAPQSAKAAALRRQAQYLTLWAATLPPAD